MKILLVYPRYPDTFWSFKHALKFISKDASFPPLGLLTIAAMLPKEWQLKLVNMNMTNLSDNDIRWADYVFISAMVTQRSSAKEVIVHCRRLGTKIVAVQALAPWASVEDVVAEMEFEPLVSPTLENIDVPSEEELSVLRAEVDPTGRTVRGRWITVELDGERARLVEQEAPAEGA